MPSKFCDKVRDSHYLEHRTRHLCSLSESGPESFLSTYRFDQQQKREDKMMNSVNYLLNMDLGRPWPVKGIASSQLWNKKYEPMYEGSFQGVYILSYKTLATTKEF